jgi:hypothetical protein
LNQSIPFDLIERMVVFRRNQVLQKWLFTPHSK